VVVNVISGDRARALTKAEDVEEMLEGVLPIVGFSLADEDYDPTPVPTGCHRCWRTGGEPCFRCSDDADAMASWEAEKAGVRKGRRARCAS
jgi:hypothetical protein